MTSALLYAGVVLAGALMAPALLRRKARWTFERFLAAVALLTLVVVIAARGEAAWGTALTAVHLTVVTIWIGAVLELAAATVLRRRTDWRSDAKAFTPIAVTSAALISITGLLMALRDHVGWATLVSTTFGLLVLLKVVALAVAAVLGLGHRFARDNRGGTLLLRGEASVLAVALAFGSALVATATPAEAVTVALPGLSTVALPGSAPVSLFLYDDSGNGRLLLASDEDVAITDRATGAVTQLAPGAVGNVTLRHGRADLSITSGEGTRNVRLREAVVPTPTSPWLGTATERTAFALGRTLARASRTSPICLPDTKAVAAVTAGLLRRRAGATVLDGPSDAALARLHRIAASPRPPSALVLAPSLLGGDVLTTVARLRLPPVTVVGIGDPTSTLADRYRAALQIAGAGAGPTLAGLLGWESALAPSTESRVGLYAAAPIGFLPGVLEVGHSHGDVAWIPGGALVAAGPTASVPLICTSEVAR